MKIQFLLGIVYLMSSVAWGQSLLVNGDFEQADPANPQKPAHWDLPDGLGVQWAASPVGSGKSICMDTSIPEDVFVANCNKVGVLQWVFPNPKKNAISDTYGLSLYSEAVPVEPGKAYRVSFDYWSEKGTEAKVWFRGYGDLAGKKKRLYEGVIPCASRGQWQHFTGLFHPTKHRPGVVEFKVMLFAYHPPGVCWFDNVTVEAVTENPPAP